MNYGAVVFSVLFVFLLSLPPVAGWRALAEEATPALPGAIDQIPVDFRFIFSVDIKKLLASPLYQQMAREQGDSLLAKYRHLFDETGLEPARDIEWLLGAARSNADDSDSSLALIVGTFNRDAITSALKRRGASEKKYGKYRIQTMHEQQAADSLKARLNEKSIVFLSYREAVVGDLDALESLLDVCEKKKPGIRSDPKMTALLGSVNTGDMIWFAGDAATAIKNFPVNSPLEQPGLNAATFLSAITGSVNLTDVFGGTLTAVAVDTASAEKLAGTAALLLQVARTSATQNPGAKLLLDGLSLSREAERIVIRLNYQAAFFEQLLNMTNTK